ncbi:hypothetical protein G3D72_001216 [Escherichia coli]|uniref:hypothetical protein n=1 Tax=Escherichia coli TaxID=562 RepID=UPI0016B8A617|nr:hypothetical protein [Escherichia coli]EFC6797872.1 hypothetical protein [Escherichia coli]EFJ4021646.1 hypothetical protein [Escherichia coli]MCV4303733.1 hypothetical protein [Escherichia coli]MED0300824.1 hypothetical protein [Escherichia coli]HAL6822686.1 hypothetical protein [Escherichia coli]
MDIGLLTWLVDNLKGWVNLKREEKLAAIEGLTPAVAATIAYNDKINSGRDRNEDEEIRLHELWYIASSSVSRYDRELAMVCGEKAKYWLKYDQYTDKHVADLKIKLIEVAQKLEDLKYS